MDGDINRAGPRPGAHVVVGPSLRASDAECEATVRRLGAAVGEGRLDLGEAEPRIASAYAARYRAELHRLVADLPDVPSDPVPAGWARVWENFVRQAWWSLACAGAVPRVAPGHAGRAVAAGLVLVLIWAAAWLLAGFAGGLVG
jgi:hypothetical protein